MDPINSEETTADPRRRYFCGSGSDFIHGYHKAMPSGDCNEMIAHKFEFHKQWRVDTFEILIWLYYRGRGHLPMQFELSTGIKNYPFPSEWTAQTSPGAVTPRLINGFDEMIPGLS